MKKSISIFSITLNLLFLLFIFATFYLQYEYLFVTRVVAIGFAIVYLVIELNKEYFLANKIIFIVFGAVSLIALIVSILVDNASVTGVTNERTFLIPVFVFILLRIMYNDSYNENKS